MNDKPRTLFEKLWNAHVVTPETADKPAVLYIDLHLIHEVTSPQAFSVLRTEGLRVRRPDRTLATMDHSTPTRRGTTAGGAAAQLDVLAKNCAEFGITLHDMDSKRRGIVHVIGPELGATQPGKTIVCGDSHTSTHGAFGALSFGIGTTEVGHVLATQCLLQRKAKTLAINVDGKLSPGVGAKDLILAIIGQIGVDGGTGHVIEYRGPAIVALDMEQRMTVCNMSIEAGARAGLIAPDETTFEYMLGRPLAPHGDDWGAALARWRQLPTDDGAAFDREVSIDASNLEPMITFGTNPGMVVPVNGTVPDGNIDDATRSALAYMGLKAGQRMAGHPVDVVFVGSCTNGRLSDIRQVASVLEGRRVADGVTMLVVPGSQEVKRAAEAEGLHRIILDAGADWRESGCSMCIAMNGDRVAAGRTSVSTSNRNFEGRQGPGARTLLASPLTAAASAVAGCVADARTLLAG